MKIIRIGAIVLMVLLLVAGSAGFHLFGREPIPETTDYVIDPAALSRAAQSIEGALPIAVNHVWISEATLPHAAVFGGFDFTPHTMVHGAYQVIYPDGRYGLIDAGFGPAVFEQMAAQGGGEYDADAFDALKQAMRGADWIVFTHEHSDHLEGIAELDDAESIAPRILLNVAQRANPQTADLLPQTLLDAIDPQTFDGPTGIAPGVAVQPAAGHTPGSQLVHVHLASGANLLFIGDVAWHLDAVRRLEYRPRIVTDYFLGEDRAAVMDQYRALHALLDDPRLEIIPSHDKQLLAELEATGVLGKGLAGAGI